MAASVTRGVQSHPGLGVTIKHFCCNNQEDKRETVSENVPERALREIYLRGFEIAVRKSKPWAVMTSYNLVNGVHTFASNDLCTKALRNEWEYQGLVMTDWTASEKKPRRTYILHPCGQRLDHARPPRRKKGIDRSP